MGVITVEISDNTLQTLRQYVLYKHGTLRGHFKKTVEQAIKEFLERRLAKEAEKAKKKVVGSVNYKDIIDFVLESASAPGPVGPAGRKAEDKNFSEETKEKENFGKEQKGVLGEEVIKRALGGVYPHRMNVKAVMKILRGKGYTELEARRAIDLLVVNGIYERDGNFLVLKEGK